MSWHLHPGGMDMDMGMVEDDDDEVEDASARLI